MSRSLYFNHTTPYLEHDTHIEYEVSVPRARDMPQRLIYLSTILTKTLYVLANVTQGGYSAIDGPREASLAILLSSLGRTEDLHARRVVKTDESLTQLIRPRHCGCLALTSFQTRVSSLP